jgi:hypothetical protein
MYTLFIYLKDFTERTLLTFHLGIISWESQIWVWEGQFSILAHKCSHSVNVSTRYYLKLDHKSFIHLIYLRSCGTARENLTN